MSDKELTERNVLLFQQINTWIENADNKVNVSCGIFTGVLGIITFLSGRIQIKSTIIPAWYTIYRVFFVLSLVVMGFSILFYVLAINPNLASNAERKNTNEGEEPPFPIFFRDITKMDIKDFASVINSSDYAKFNAELVNEIHHNSGVCDRKMTRYRIGLWLSFVAVAFAGVSWIAHYLMMIQ